MFPDNIKQILEKYYEENQNEIHCINNEVNEISTQFRKIRSNLSKKLRTLIDNDDSDDTQEDELIANLRILKGYMNSIAPISVSSEKVEIAEELTPVISAEDTKNNIISISTMFSKKVYPYLIDDDVCPECNVKLRRHYIHYQRIINETPQEESVSWYKCHACNKLFAIDYDAENFDFENTNIDLRMKYYNKILLSDTIYVVDSINTHSSDSHKLVDKKAILTLIQEDGQPCEQTVTITYCEKCNKIYMLKDTYDNLSGTPICSIIDETKLLVMHSCDEVYISEKTKGSKLTQYGYNVNCIEKLSSKQRRSILLMQVLSGNMEQNEIVSIINSDIQRSESTMWNGSKRDLTNAISKWKEDKEYIQNIQIDKKFQYVNVSNIILKYNRYIK